MNAITVNYAEVGDDHLPKSFGLAYTSHLANSGFYIDGVSHIFNASVTELTGTSYSLVQGRGTYDYDKDIIVTTATPTSTSLHALRGIKNQTWINFYQPSLWDNDEFVWLNYKSNTGKFYTIIEKDNFPAEKEIGYSVQVSQILENENGCYNQIALTTKAALAFTAATNKVTLKHDDLILFTLDSTLKVLKENANDDNFVTLSSSIADSCQVDEYENYINPALTVWTHEGTEVAPGIELVSSSGIVKKYTESVSGDQRLYRVLTGNNEVKFYRKRKDLIVNFTFTGVDFSYVDASCNNRDNSYQESVSQLVIPETKYGKTCIKFEDYFTNSSKLQFSPASIAVFNGNSPVSCAVTISIGTITDTIYYTGCLSNGSYVSNKQYSLSHDILATDYALNEITLNNVSSITTNDSYLTHNPGTKTFRRHREVKRKYQEWWIFVGWIDKSDVRETTYYLDDNQALGNVNFDTGKRYVYSYSDSNNNPKQFYATAHYNGIPYAVPVTAPNNSAAANNDQVVSFEGAYYVADSDMKSLVESLVSGVTVNVQKVITRYTNWSTIRYQTYYEVTEDIPNSSTQTSHQDTTGAISVGTGTSYIYTAKTAAINIYGFGNQVTSVVSADPNITAQLSSQYIDSNTNSLVVSIAYNVSAGFSLTNLSPSDYREFGTEIIFPNIWNQVLTYKFFN